MTEKAADEKYCASCGSTIKKEAEICPNCGVRQVSTPSYGGQTIAPNGKNKLTAALLALFIGGFGVHKFYLGQNGVGVVYLLFCWTFIPALLALIDFIVLLGMSDKEFVQKYGML
jgi:TM2 domain-containing membrane protein YozV